MGVVNLTRYGKNNQKRETSVSVATIKAADMPSAANYYQLFVLPARSIIKRVDVFVETAGQALLTCDLGYAGSNELGNDVDLATATIVDNVLATPLYTGTGKTVTIQPSAIPTSGVFTVIVEYIELDKTCGEYTNFA